MIRIVQIAKLHVKSVNLEDAVSIIVICVEEMAKNMKNAGQV